MSGARQTASFGTGDPDGAASREIADFIARCFRDVRPAGDGRWLAGGHEAVSYGEDLHDENAVFEQESFWFRQRNQVFLDLIKRFDMAGPLLDVGGGTGIVTRFLNDHGVPAVNMEPTASGAELAARRGVPTIVSTLQKARVRPGSLSSAGMFDVLEHIPEEAEALAALHEALRPGGHLLVAVPAHGWLWSLEDRVAGHCRRYSRSSLRRSLEHAGFEVLFLTHLFSFLVAPVLLLRAVPTLWGRIGRESQEDKRSLHVPKPRVAPIVDRLGAWERGRLASGREISMGTSVVAVARRRVP